MIRSHAVGLHRAMVRILVSGTISTTVVASEWCITNLTLTVYSGFRSEALVCIVKITFKRGCQWKPGKMLNAMSSYYSNIIDRLMVKYNGVMVKYNKHRCDTAFVLEIRALSAIFFKANFDHFLTLTIKRGKFIFCMRHNTAQGYFIKP